MKPWILKLFGVKVPEPERIVRNRVHVVSGTSIGLRLEEWRQDDALVSAARKLAEDQTFRAQLDVLRTESPTNYQLSGPVSQSQIENLKQLGRIEGYHQCLNNIEAMTRRLEIMERPDETFEPEELEPTKQEDET